MRAEQHPLFPLVVVADCWLQRLLIWTPGQTDLIKTVALVLMGVRLENGKHPTLSLFFEQT